MLTFVGDDKNISGPQTHYFEKGKLIKLFNNELSFLDLYIKK